MRADIRGGYGAQGFIPVGLTFPTVGCWRVTGKLGNARLTYVVRVTKLPSWLAQAPSGLTDQSLIG